MVLGCGVHVVFDEKEGVTTSKYSFRLVSPHVHVRLPKAKTRASQQARRSDVVFQTSVQTSVQAAVRGCFFRIAQRPQRNPERHSQSFFPLSLPPTPHPEASLLVLTTASLTSGQSTQSKWQSRRLEREEGKREVVLSPPILPRLLSRCSSWRRSPCTATCTCGVSSTLSCLRWCLTGCHDGTTSSE